MDYETKYNEALKRAKKELQTCGSTDCDAARQIFRLFPELAESEDEKIRKALIEMVHDTTGDSLWIDYDIHKEETLAWLEKQGSQILANSAKTCKDEQIPAWSEEDKVGLDDALWCCKQAASIAKDENDMGNAWYAENWLKSLKERIGG